MKRIKSNPWVKNIYIGRELPNRLVLELRERQPLALLKDKEKFYLVDNEGYVFKEFCSSDEVDLPVITGLKNKDEIQSPLFSETLKLLGALHNSRRYAYLGVVSEININEVFGLSLLTEKGLYIKLGMKDFENKLNNLKIVIADLKKRGLMQNWLCMDMGDDSKIIVQRKNTFVKKQEYSEGARYRI